MIWDITIVIVYMAMSAFYVWLYARADLARRGSWLALGTGTSERTMAREERVKGVDGLGRPAGGDPAPLDHGLDLRAPDQPRLLVQLDHGADVHRLGAGLRAGPRDPARPRCCGASAGSRSATTSWRCWAASSGVFIAVEAFLVLAEYLTATLPGRRRGRRRRAGCSSGRTRRSSGSRSCVGLVRPVPDPRRSGRLRRNPAWVATAAGIAIVGHLRPPPEPGPQRALVRQHPAAARPADRDGPGRRRARSR